MAPSSLAFNTILRNSSTVRSLLRAVMVAVKRWFGGAGNAPICPADTSVFCDWIAARTSDGISAYWFSRDGSSQMRIA